MTVDRWQEVARIYDAVLALAPDERADAIVALSGSDAELRHHIELLFDESREASSPLELSTAELAAALLEADERLEPGAAVGAYRIISLLGVGGMGEVYRVHDEKLNRDVAIKILPAALSRDPERLARFRREAQMLGALSHPNIATIHELEVVDPTAPLDAQSTGIVMELVEGLTLAERLHPGASAQRRALPIAEVVAIARQIAEALEAAHELGIVHRDLKPANIKVREDGTVKVLDFGLAKIAETPAADRRTSQTSQSPAITTPAMTAAGIILGTAAYMSPEQARGKPADKRSDIWAFGCIVYEMLSGARAFEGNDVAEVVASVLAREPDWSRLPDELSPALRVYLKRCLQRQPKQRLADIQDMRLALQGAFDTPAPSYRRRSLAVAGGAAMLSAAVVAAFFAWRSPALPPRPISRFPLATSAGAAPTVSGFTRDLTTTPDGSRIVYIGNGNTQLFVRALDALDPVAVYTGNPNGPFVSPDGRWIGFVDGIDLLMKVPIGGGPVITLAKLSGAFRGAAWLANDTIILATDSIGTGLQRISAAGGPLSDVTRPDAAADERDHLWPRSLPGGQSVLFTISSLTAGLAGSKVAAVDLQTGRRSVLIQAASDASYAPSGHLVYAAAGTLRAVAFDLKRMEASGVPVPVIPDVAMTRSGGVDAGVGTDGTLVYLSGGVANLNGPQALVWVDRRGLETTIPAPPHAYSFPRLSPDGRGIAAFSGDQNLDIWTWDLEAAKSTQISFGEYFDNFPMWTPDSHRLLFTSNRDGPRNIYAQAADGASALERLTNTPNPQFVSDVTADGRMIYTETRDVSSEDVLQMTLDASHRITPLLQSPSVERNGVVSPDGRWLAYESDETGRFDIHVRPLPDTGSGHWLVSTAGGTRPLWSRNGKELFFVTAAGALMRVGMERGPGSVTVASVVLSEGAVHAGYGLARTYDVDATGERFLLTRGAEAPNGGALSLPPAGGIVVVLNWAEELKRLVPPK